MKIILILIILSISFLTIPTCLGFDTGINATRNVADLPEGSIPIFLGRIIGGVAVLSGSIFLFLIVYGGFFIMTAAGNQERINKGRQIITWAIIGALVIGSAYSITNLVFQAFT